MLLPSRISFIIGSVGLNEAVAYNLMGQWQEMTHEGFNRMPLPNEMLCGTAYSLRHFAVQHG